MLALSNGWRAGASHATEGQPMKISLITTCKSRLQYLQQVLPSWLEFKPFEIVVVDVACPQGTKLWLNQNYPEVKVVYEDYAGFNLAAARNKGAGAATGDYFLFVDADVVLHRDYHDWIVKNLQANTFLLRHQDNLFEGIHEQGTVLCKKEDFFKIHGYDEVLQEYGGEDLDLYEKLARAGVKKLSVPREFYYAIEHSDEERFLHHEMKDRTVVSIITRTYRAAKAFLLTNSPEVYELPAALRTQIWQTCKATLGTSAAEMPSKSDIVVKANQAKWLPEPYYLSCELTLKLNVKARQNANKLGQ